MKFNLSIFYEIPESGKYEYDLLATELAGKDAKETSFGSIMFHTRIISYEFPDQSSLNETIQKFQESNIFQVMSY